jgi:transcriptional regulator with XRE-family HTH domain
MDDFDKYLNEQLTNEEFKEEYEKLAPEYEFRRALTGARIKANLTQKQLAELMGTKQSAIARLESGRQMPTLDTLQKLAQVLGVDFIVGPDGRVSANPHRAT